MKKTCHSIKKYKKLLSHDKILKKNEKSLKINFKWQYISIKAENIISGAREERCILILLSYYLARVVFLFLVIFFKSNDYWKYFFNNILEY